MKMLFFFHMVVSHVEIYILFSHVVSHAQLEVKSFAFQFHTLLVLHMHVKLERF